MSEKKNPKAQSIDKEQIEKSIVDDLKQAFDTVHLVTGDTENEESLTALKSDENDLSLQLAEANEKIAEQNNLYLRLSAEFDNFRRRTMKEKVELIKHGGEQTITSILPIIDDFERALELMPADEKGAPIKEGVTLIYQKLVATMAQNGANVIETEGVVFDTEYHEAITTIPAPTEELKGKIVDCLQKGYLLHGKVIRYAKVVVGE